MIPNSFEDFLGEMADAQGNQERGICQVCGREQAIRSKGNITHHGYTIEYGWFHGSCPGQQHPPLQHDKSVTEKIIKDIEAEIPKIQHLITDLKAGKKFPLKVRKSNRSVDRDVFIPWAEAADWQKKAELTGAIFNEERRLRSAQQTVEMLHGLIATYHGQAVKTVAKGANVRPKMEVGSVVNIAGKKGVTITKIEARRAQGVGPNLNGQMLDHAYWTDPVTGREHSYPLKLARWPK